MLSCPPAEEPPLRVVVAIAVLLAAAGCGGAAPAPAGGAGGDPAVTDDSGSIPGDTGEGDAPSCGAVTFTADADGATTDLTAAFEAGEELVLSEDGQLDVCTGTWFSLVTVRAAVRVVGGSADPLDTILSGGESGSVLVVEGAGAALTVERVVLERGAARGERNAAAGGGLRCTDGATVSLSDAVVRDNFAYDGGGLYGGRGCTLTVERVRLDGNQSGDDGGALRLDDATATLVDVTISNSTARDGGAVLAWQSALRIQGGRFEGNTSTDSQGGAILHYSGDLSVSGTTFRDNRSLEVGGALASFGPATLVDVRFERNASTEGGAAYVYTTNGRLDCTRCSFARNQPDDVALDVGGSFDFGEDVDVVCDAGGCR